MSDDADELSLFGEPTPPPNPAAAFPSAPMPDSDASGYSPGRDDHGRVRQADSHCRSCKRRIRWVSFPSGKRNPLDAEPDLERGNIAVIERRGPGGAPWRIAALIHSEGILEEARTLGLPLYVTHFDTCPDADEHRREQGRRTRRDLE